MAQSGLSKNSEFELIWLEAVLTRGVLTQADLILFLKHFGLGSYEEFSSGSNEILEMVYVALNELPLEKLLPEVRQIIENEYSDRLSLEEAGDVVFNLRRCDLRTLSDFYTLSLGEERLKDSVNEDDLVVCILGVLYKLPKERALTLVWSLKV